MNIGTSQIQDTVTLAARMKVYSSPEYKDLVGIQEAIKACEATINFMPQLMNTAAITAATIDMSSRSEDEKEVMRQNQDIAMLALSKANALLTKFVS